VSTLVQLIDGKFVERDAEEWRHECEARYVLSLSSLEERRRFLSVIESKRGLPAANALRWTMTLLHEEKAE
jgi:hypothetical protein